MANDHVHYIHVQLHALLRVHYNNSPLEILLFLPRNEPDSLELISYVSVNITYYVS